MSDAVQQQRAEALAHEAATRFLEACQEAGLPWDAVMVSAETFATVVAASCARMSGTARPALWVETMLTVMVATAQARAMKILEGAPQGDVH